MRLSFFSLPPPKDEKIEDSVIIRGNNYEMRGPLHLGQNK